MADYVTQEFIYWLSTLAMSVAVALMIASALSISTGFMLNLSPENKLWAFIVAFAFLCSLAMAPQAANHGWGKALLLYLLPILIVMVYFLPTAVAVSDSHPSFREIFIVNLFLGWTVLGWCAALTWSLIQPRVDLYGFQTAASDTGVSPAKAEDSSKPA
jgi:hypothetical protein